jgi:hypothetical protein
MDPKALELAKRIVEIDLQRDVIFEQLIQLIGDRAAYEVLRSIQNCI